MVTISKVIAWVLVAAVVFATLGPAYLRPRSSLGHTGEHVLAFLLLGIAFGIAYRENRLSMAFVSVISIAVLELLQLVAPGRHARLRDFAVDAASACLGILLAACWEWLVMRGGSAA